MITRLVSQVIALAVAGAVLSALWLPQGPRALVGAAYMAAALAILVAGHVPVSGSLRPSGALVSVRVLTWRTDPTSGAVRRTCRIWHVGTNARLARLADVQAAWREWRS